MKEGEIRGFVAVALSVEWLEEEARHYPLEGITALSLVDLVLGQAMRFLVP